LPRSAIRREMRSDCIKRARAKAWIGLVNCSVEISARKKATQNSLRQKSRASYSQNHGLHFLTLTGKVSSCVRGSATPRKLERTSLAIAAVRRPLAFRSNDADKTRRGDRSRFPRPFDSLRIAFDVLYKPPSRRRIVCSFLFSLHRRSLHFGRQRR
jgi:hypothetical protein